MPVKLWPKGQLSLSDSTITANLEICLGIQEKISTIGWGHTPWNHLRIEYLSKFEVISEKLFWVLNRAQTLREFLTKIKQLQSLMAASL
jgi:hypothetical protein